MKKMNRIALLATLLIPNLLHSVKFSDIINWIRASHDTQNTPYLATSDELNNIYQWILQNNVFAFERALLKNPKLVHAHIDIPLFALIKYTPLHKAAIFNKPEIAQLLLDYNANIDAEDDIGRTPLHCAIAGHHREIVQILLDNGADVNHTTANGKTMLHVAAETNRADLVQLLLDKGAKVNAQDNDGITPLHTAAGAAASYLGKLDVIKLLLAHGANIHAQIHNGELPIDRVFMCTPTWPDAINSSQKVANFLSKEMLNQKKNKPTTKILRKIAEALQNKQIDEALKLLKRDSNLAPRILQKLIASIRANQIEEALDLIKQHPKLVFSYRDADDNTLLHIAAQTPKITVAMLTHLVAAMPALVRIKNKQGLTPLHLVAGDPDFVQVFMGASGKA